MALNSLCVDTNGAYHRKGMVSIRVLFLGGEKMVKLNGEDVLYKERISLYEFLISQNFNPAFVAVEVNENLVKRENFKEKIIEDEHIIEVFTFVGGG